MPSPFAAFPSRFEFLRGGCSEEFQDKEANVCPTQVVVAHREMFSTSLLFVLNSNVAVMSIHPNFDGVHRLTHVVHFALSTFYCIDDIIGTAADVLFRPESSAIEQAADRASGVQLGTHPTILVRGTHVSLEGN